LVSPLKRAWQTYEHAQPPAGHVEFDSRLVESDWGIDRYYESILPVAAPGIACADRHDAWLVAVAKRSLSLVKSLLRAPEEKILLFGHWGIFNNLLHTFTGMDPCGFSVLAPMDNTAISLLEIDDQDRRVIRYWNDRAHVIDLI
jgi:broad specificity phosphatase PhoE